MNTTLFLTFLKTYNIIQCLTTILQNSISPNENFLVSLDSNFQLNIPTQRLSGTFSTNKDWFLDITPDIYLANLSKNKNSLKWIENIDSYNSSALFILIDGNKAYLRQELGNRLISKVVFMNTSNISRDNCTNKVLIDEDLKENYDRAKTEVELTICVLERKPYVLCRVPNCTSLGPRGLSIDLIEMVFELSNTTPYYKHFDNIEGLLNLNPRTILLNDSCDLVQRLIVETEKDLDVISPINDDYDIWIVPRSGKIPKWKYPMMVFSTPVWLTLLFTTIFATGSWYILDFYMDRNQGTSMLKKEGFKEKLVVFLRIFLEQPCNLTILYKPQFILLLGLFLTISTFTTMYKSKLSVLLLNPSLYETSIKSVEDVFNKGFYIYFGDIRRSFLEESYEEMKNYTKRSEPYGVNWLDIVAFRKDSAVLVSSAETMYQSSSYLDEDGRNLLQPLLPPYIKCFSGFNYIRGHPLIIKFGRYITKLRDHGFVEKIIKKYEYSFDEFERNFGTSRKLSMETLIGPFVAWLFGIIIATVVFFVEVARNR